MRRKTTEEFIEQSEKIHGEKYDYSSVEYVNAFSKVFIKCLEHGDFQQRPSDHLDGAGCPKCGKISTASARRRSLESFVEAAKFIHGNKYDYSKIIKWENSRKNIPIICKKHGLFNQIGGNHLNGAGCPKCAIVTTATKKTKSTICFVNEAKKVHGNKYDYSFAKYLGVHKNLEIICKKHGMFLQSPHNHLAGSGCKGCSSSKGEKFIEGLLEKRSIEFVRQKTFSECRNIQPLRFDFYLPKQNILIEYDGAQHFKPFAFSYSNDANIQFEKLKEHDRIKNEWAKSNNIVLIRVPYTWSLEKITKFIESI